MAGRRGQDPQSRRPRPARDREAADGTREFDAFRAWESSERLYVNVATIDRDLDGKGPIPSNPIARARAFDGVACLCQHLKGIR